MAASIKRAKLREQIFARDFGVCARCRCDAEFVELMYERAMRIARESSMPDVAIKAVRVRFTELGFAPSRPFWEADHEVPLIEGGADALTNLRTLCQPCHREATKDLAARRARRRPKRSSRWRPKGVCPGVGRAARRDRLTGGTICRRCGCQVGVDHGGRSLRHAG